MILLRIYNIINFVKSYLPFKSFFSRYNPLLIIYTPLIEKASSSPTSFFFFISLRISYMQHSIPACTISTIHALSYTILHSCAILYYTYPMYRFILYLSSTCNLILYLPPIFSNRSLYAFNCSSLILSSTCTTLYHPICAIYYN